MFYDVGLPNRATELQYDVNVHSMLALMMDKSKAPDFTWIAGDKHFTFSAIRRRGIRYFSSVIGIFVSYCIQSILY